MTKSPVLSTVLGAFVATTKTISSLNEISSLIKKIQALKKSCKDLDILIKNAKYREILCQ